MEKADALFLRQGQSPNAKLPACGAGSYSRQIKAPASVQVLSKEDMKK
jgi:hypothetical protein